MVGGLPSALGGLRSAPWLAAASVGVIDRGTAKARFLHATSADRTRSDLEAVAARFATKQLPAMIRPEMASRVKERRRCGHGLVLVSASPDLNLRPRATRAGFDAVLATELEFCDERFTASRSPGHVQLLEQGESKALAAIRPVRSEGHR